jgi:hypothetical protein
VHVGNRALRFAFCRSWLYPLLKNIWLFYYLHCPGRGSGQDGHNYRQGR